MVPLDWIASIEVDVGPAFPAVHPLSDFTHLDTFDMHMFGVTLAADPEYTDLLNIRHCFTVPSDGLPKPVEANSA